MSSAVCASLESAQKLLFTGVKAGEVSTSECPDVKILGNVAKEKCLGRDSWDSSLSKPCPEVKMKYASVIVMIVYWEYLEK